MIDNDIPPPIKGIEKIWEILKYKKIQLIGIIFAIIAYIIIAYCANENLNLLALFFGMSDTSYGFLSYIQLDLVTVIFVVFIWFSNARKEWYNSLNALSYTDFHHKGTDQICISLRYYPLLDRGSEIRQMPQSIAKSVINEGQNLPLEPMVKNIEKTIVVRKTLNNGKPFLLIKADQYLSELDMRPSKDNNGKGVDLNKKKLPVIESFKP